MRLSLFDDILSEEDNILGAGEYCLSHKN